MSLELDMDLPGVFSSLYFSFYFLYFEEWEVKTPWIAVPRSITTMCLSRDCGFIEF
jgi:hypothetical protein